MKRFLNFFPRLAVLVAVVVILTPSAKAQDMINEDFLDNIEANAKFILDEASPAFTTNTTPDKWKTESAVVIGYKRSILFDKKSSGGFFTARDRSVYFFEKVRFKIKLNDNNAVDNFSEIYFRYNAKEDGFIARIIKPTGEITNVDLKDAVGIEASSDMPEFFKSFFDQIYGAQRRYFKVAVPNLEPGDISLCLYGFNGDANADRYFHHLRNGMMNGIPAGAWKMLCGEYQTSTAFAMWLSALMLKMGRVPLEVLLDKQDIIPENILICNHYMGANHSLILLTRN